MANISLSKKEREIITEYIERDIRIQTKIAYSVSIGGTEDKQTAKNRINMVMNIIKKFEYKQN